MSHETAVLILVRNIGSQCVRLVAVVRTSGILTEPLDRVARDARYKVAKRPLQQAAVRVAHISARATQHNGAGRQLGRLS